MLAIQEIQEESLLFKVFELRGSTVESSCEEALRGAIRQPLAGAKAMITGRRQKDSTVGKLNLN